ncbi:5-formyltetrahydrofolate cyclo-ligase-like isoform X2 [Strigops habroptila]|uniref:5-formyltetrahydrofolate cyclo-ligase-like isoform X2 n=1 Tax=Strigops habroptila TaxID=2489341 RepID=UPI0011CFDB4F|nr:5-formyltetrahydrofolate cyclo-ligase-like isoform X2 [Strigops habroptila]
MERPGEGGEMAAAALRAAKRALRGELRQRLRALGAAEKQRQSRLLACEVIGHPKYQESKRIAIFLSMPDEIQTEEIIKDIFKQGKECFIPRYKPHSNHMDMLKLSSAEDISSLTLTSWNILQPSDGDSAREEALAGGQEQDCTVDPTERNSTLQINQLLGYPWKSPHGYLQHSLSKHNIEAHEGDGLARSGLGCH